jgi:hypothetical protein
MASGISTWRPDFSGPISARAAINFVLVTSAYIAAYAALDRISMVQELPAIGFTLWNPTPACSLALLLVMGLRYAPALFVAVAERGGRQPMRKFQSDRIASTVRLFRP